MQLVDGVTWKAGNEMIIDNEVEANSSVGYRVTIGLLGINVPVTCNFKYEYNGKLYYTAAVYTNN